MCMHSPAVERGPAVLLLPSRPLLLLLLSMRIWTGRSVKQEGLCSAQHCILLSSKDN
jgi:hypothetical protein